mgnify:FL=1
MKLDKVVIITHGQICAQPRTVKQAISLSKKYEVSVIYCPMSPWGDQFDNTIICKNPQIKWIRVGAHQIENPLKYFFLRLRRTIWQSYYRFFGSRFHSALKSFSLYSQDLLTEARKHEADIIIGHNLGSIRAVVETSKKYNALSCFDFEDYHRGEISKKNIEFQLIKKIEDTYVVFLDRCFSASPLIAKAYQSLYPKLNIITINNCFSVNYQAKIFNEDLSPLKIFWFSQHIGKKRGLEQMIRSIGLIKDQKIELTLLGNISALDKIYFEKLIEKNTNGIVNFLPPVEEKKIFEIASEHHIGLASETGKDLNNNIALSNKIFTYLLAGNAILFSNTEAQEHFYNEHSNIGFLYSNGNDYELANLLRKYISQPELLREHRQNSIHLSSSLNWENESKKLFNCLKTST